MRRRWERLTNAASLDVFSTEVARESHGERTIYLLTAISETAADPARLAVARSDDAMMGQRLLRGGPQRTALLDRAEDVQEAATIVKSLSSPDRDEVRDRSGDGSSIPRLDRGTRHSAAARRLLALADPQGLIQWSGRDHPSIVRG